MMKKDLFSKIINKVPYQHPFLFVDEITELSENKIVGKYTFRTDHSFYKGHFKEYPVTPGVILIETMGQIGLVCYGIYLLNLFESKKTVKPVLSYVESEFSKIVYPDDTVTVVSERIYLRKSILKSSMIMFDQMNEEIARTKAICKFL